MGAIVIPRFFFMLQRLQWDWGTRDTWIWDRSTWARVNYRWVLLDSFLIRFLVASHRRRAIYTPFLSQPPRFLLPPKISGMIQPDPCINHLSSKLDNGFVSSFIAYQPNSLNIYRAHLQSSLRDIDKRAWIYCHSLEMYEACKKSRGSDFKIWYFVFIALS